MAETASMSSIVYEIAKSAGVVVVSGAGFFVVLRAVEFLGALF